MESLPKPEEQFMIICAWCTKIIREGRCPASHGICPTCREREFPNYKDKIQNVLHKD
jgi:hypothetical protein